MLVTVTCAVSLLLAQVPFYEADPDTCVIANVLPFEPLERRALEQTEYRVQVRVSGGSGDEGILDIRQEWGGRIEGRVRRVTGLELQRISRLRCPKGERSSGGPAGVSQEAAPAIAAHALTGEQCPALRSLVTDVKKLAVPVARNSDLAPDARTYELVAQTRSSDLYVTVNIEKEPHLRTVLLLAERILLGEECPQRGEGEPRWPPPSPVK